jgi:hypothetical protein
MNSTTPSKSISLTLNRWHKVVERINASISENTALLKKRVEDTNFNVTTKASYSQALVTKYALEAAQAVTNITNLQADLVRIKDQVAAANLEHGITSKLTRIDAAQRTLAAYKLITGSTEGKMSYSTFEGLDVNVADASRASYALMSGRSAGYPIAILDESFIELVKKAEVDAKRTLVKLSDDISDLNRNKVCVALSATAIEIAALE